MVWWWWILPAFVALIGGALLVGGFGALFRGQGFKGGRGLFGGALFMTLAGAAGLVGLNVQTYSRLTYQRPVAEISVSELGPQLYRVTLVEPNGRVDDYEVRGDEWRVDARVLVWKPWANILGLDSQYRLERLEGRYENIEQARTGERTVYDLGATGAQNRAVDVWALSRLMGQKAAFVPTVYGGSVYMPMANDAKYDIIITQSGLIATPKNVAAQSATTHWDVAPSTDR
jgi:hypothetical protein